MPVDAGHHLSLGGMRGALDDKFAIVGGVGGARMIISQVFPLFIIEARARCRVDHISPS